MSYSSKWIMLVLLCTSAPLVLCYDWFNHGSRQVKHDPVDLVTVDYYTALCCQIGLSEFLKEPPVFSAPNVWIMEGCWGGESMGVLMRCVWESLGDGVWVWVWVWWCFWGCRWVGEWIFKNGKVYMLIFTISTSMVCSVPFGQKKWTEWVLEKPSSITCVANSKCHQLDEI